MIINEKNLQLILKPNENWAEWLDPLQNILPEFDINTTQRITHFLSQTIAESDYYEHLEENLNYSAKRILEIFPKHFSIIEYAERFQHNPEKLANKVYANRMGNGNEASGDGWKYRGRGLIQLTGKDNYDNFSQFVAEKYNVTLKKPDIIATNKKMAIISACWFWEKNDLNNYADQGLLYLITKTITGSAKDFQKRSNLYEQIHKILEKENAT